MEPFADDQGHTLLARQHVNQLELDATRSVRHGGLDVSDDGVLAVEIAGER
jgi:hypothetical protein